MSIITIYNDPCRFCNSIISDNINHYFCKNCQVEFFNFEMKNRIARSFLYNNSFQPLISNYDFDLYFVYDFKNYELSLFNRGCISIFSTAIKPNINLIKSTALKFNKLLKYA